MKSLVIDDDSVCRKILALLLRVYGPVDVAVDAQQGMEFFQQSMMDGEPYHVVFLDIVMPEVDGNETLRQIRKLEAQYGIGGLDSVKIIMVSAMNDSANIINAFKEQCEGYIVKPASKEKLEKELHQLKLLSQDQIN